MKVLPHRHHLSAELRNQLSVAHHKLEVTPSCFHKKRKKNAESSFKIGCSSEHTTSEDLDNSSGSTQFFYSDEFITNWKYRCYSDGPWLWEDLKRKNQSRLYWQMVSTSRILKLKSWRQKRVLFFATSQSRCAMDWLGWGCDKGIDELTTSARKTGKPLPDFENLHFKIASGLRKIVTGNFKKQVITAGGKAQSEKRYLKGRQIAWMVHDFFKN